MALIFIDGFDHYVTGDIEEKWSSRGGSQETISSTYGRFGGQGIQFYGNNGWIKKTIAVNKTTIYFGGAVYKESTFDPGFSTSAPLIYVDDESAVRQINIHVDSSYKFLVYRGDITLLGSTADYIFETKKWFYLEVKITISATVGVIELKINGTQVLNLTSQNTKNGSDYIRNVYFSGIYSGRYTLWDDIYIDDSQYHGDCRIRTFMPDADGNSVDFTRSTGSNDYECVDEPQSNSDTDYIVSDTLNHKSIFGITTGALGTVKAIQLNNHCRLDEAGTRKIKPVIRSNSTDYQGTETDVIAANYKFESEIWELDPDDSGAWTQTKIEAAEFGLEITT